MPDIPKFMNVLNLEARNAMDTRRMEHANAYVARANGLIKSASTSTCCANENALLKKPHRRYLVREQNANADERAIDAEHDTLNFSFLSSVALSALARNATFYAIAADDTAAKNTLNFKFRLNRVKHFSDCNLNNVGLPNQLQQHQQHNHRKVSEFSTHRPALDNVLVGWRGSDGRSRSIINFTTMNDAKKDSRGMSGMLPIEKVDEERESPGEKVNEGSESRENVLDEESEKPSEKLAEQLSIEYNGGETDAVREQPASITPHKGKENFDDDDGANKENESSIANDDRRRKSSVFEPPHPSSPDRERNDVDASPTVQTAQQVQPESAPAPQEKRFRRSSSLKMPKENDANPAQKKIVRFADALGLDLADVRTFLDELPSVPKSAYSDLNSDDLLSQVDRRLSFSPSAGGPALLEKTLVPMFKQPHTSLNFLERVHDNHVSLEYAKVCPTPVCSISGVVRVRNLDFFKSVYVRYTVDGWLTFSELQAVYVPDSCDGFSDKFAFVVYVYDVKVNQRVELAIRFHCSGSQFWDNNNGSNYVFQCLPSAPIAPSYFHSYNPTNDSCNSFY